MAPALLMCPQEVPWGAIAYVCPKGMDEPPADASIVRRLLGGVPTRGKWYPSDAQGQILGSGFTRPKRGVRFAPVKTYSLLEAPIGWEFAVFAGGKRVKYDEPYNDTYVDVTKLADGTFMSVDGHAHDHWLRRYEMPTDALLVSYSEKCNYKKTIDDAVVLPVVDKNSEVWKMLSEAGGCEQEGYLGEPHYVWLPDGWLIIPRDGFTSAEMQIIVDEKGATRATVVWLGSGSNRGKGTIELGELPPLRHGHL